MYSNSKEQTLTLKTMIKIEKTGETTYKVNDTEISVIDGNIPEEAKEFILDEGIKALEDFIRAEDRFNIKSTIK